MTLQAYLDALRPGMEIIAGAQGMSATQLEALGAPDTEARMLARLAHTYFGPTKFSAKQRTARESTHSLPVLKIIERYAAKAANQAEAWRLREKLCALQAPASDIEKQARRLTRRPARGPRAGARLYRRRKAWTLAITGPSDMIADLWARLDKTKPVEQLTGLLYGGVKAAQRPTPRTNVIVRLPEFIDVLHGTGDEITLRLTNGATMTGKDYLERVLADAGLGELFTLIHPVEGPVNLYRAQRHASSKQRLMAAAENPTCPWPECNIGADEAQIHHIHPWRLGGETNMANLTTCCGYHNGVNQDDPNAPPGRGRLDRIDGVVTWHRGRC